MLPDLIDKLQKFVEEKKQKKDQDELEVME